MKTKTLPITQPATLVIASVQGDLQLRGSDAAQLRAKTSGSALEITQEGETITLTADGDLVISLPRQTAIQINKINGDASLRDLANGITLQEVLGDLTLRDAIGEMQLGQILGDCQLRDLLGGVQANIQGDLTLDLIPTEGSTTQINTGGDMLVRLPDDLDASVHFAAKGDFLFRLGDLVGYESPFERDLGLALASIHGAAGGDLLVTAQKKSVVRKAAKKANKFKQAFGYPAKKKSAVSAEERLFILKMLQEKTITAAEAEKLLDALG